MIILAGGTEERPLDDEERRFRIRALRDAVICIGWLKLVSVALYVGLFFLVFCNSSGKMSNVIQIMTLSAVGPILLHGILLFLGGLERKSWALEVSLWLCLIMASYNLVLGMLGTIYFIRAGNRTMHFLLAVIYACIAGSIFTVICHDVVLIYTYKRLITPETESSEALSVSFFVGIYFLIGYVYEKSVDDMMTVIKVMTLAGAGPLVLHGISLILSAAVEQSWIISITLWLCFFTASYNLVLGLIGAIYFGRSIDTWLHAAIVCAYFLIAISMFTILCYDISVIYEYKNMIDYPRAN